MADQKKVELGREDAAELRCARLEVEARAAEYRESLRVLEGLRLQAEHLALLSTRCAENLAREGAVAQQRAEAHALAHAAMATPRGSPRDTSSHRRESPNSPSASPLVSTSPAARTR